MLSFDEWWGNVQGMASFHLDSRLPYLWLPTPQVWESKLADLAADSLRNREMPPRTILAEGLYWYAWKPNEILFMTQEDRREWYDIWSIAMQMPSGK